MVGNLEYPSGSSCFRCPFAAFAGFPAWSMACYPHHDGLGTNEGAQAQFRITGPEALVEIASVEVARGKNLVARLRDKFFSANVQGQIFINSKH